MTVSLALGVTHPHCGSPFAMRTMLKSPALERACPAASLKTDVELLRLYQWRLAQAGICELCCVTNQVADRRTRLLATGVPGCRPEGG